MSILIAKKRDFTQGAILVPILLYALPLILTSVMQQLFNTADAIMVGRWGGADAAQREAALAAVGSCNSLIALLVNLLAGFSTGAGVSFSHAVGAKDTEQAERIVHTAVLTSVLCGGFAMLLGLVASNPLLKLMGTPSAVLGQAAGYMQAYFIGVPAQMVFNFCASLLRNDGDSTSPLYILFFAGLANVLLNFTMICVFAMGAVGVGIATAASHWVSCILVLRQMRKHQGNCRLSLRRLRLCKEPFQKIVAIGLPAGLQSSFFAITDVIIQSAINSFGTAVVAGNTAAANLGSYCSTVSGAFSRTASTYVGQNLGAKQYDRMKKGILQCMMLVSGISLIFSLVTLLFGKELLSLYVPDSADAVAAGMVRLRYVMLPYLLCGLSDCGTACLRGLGKSMQSMLLNLFFMGAFRVVWIFTVFKAFPRLEILYIVLPLSWILLAVVEFLMMFGWIKKQSAQGERTKATP